MVNGREAWPVEAWSRWKKENHLFLKKDNLLLRYRDSKSKVAG